MSAVEALKYLQAGHNARSAAKQAGVSLAVVNSLSTATTKHALRDLKRENEQLRFALKALIGILDYHANEIGAMAKQAQCVKVASTKLVAQCDARLKQVFDAVNDAEAVLAGKPIEFRKRKLKA